MEAARVDQWLWAVRIFKTRAEATEACKGGHVRVNDVAARPASRVRPGDHVGAHVHGRERVFEVVEPIVKRVGAARAAACLVDHSPPAAPPEDTPFSRSRGSGRPTKRERRQLDRLRH